MKSVTLVQNVAAAIANISRFNGAIHAGNHPEIVKIIPHAQAWYVTERDGEFLFGPSKFIGYADMTPETYAAESGVNGRLDGRVTEKKLGPWAQLITSDHPRYEAFHTALSEFCAGYGVFPNKRARISLLSEFSSNEVASEAERVTALKTLISSLSAEGKQDLKRLVWP